MFSLELPYRGDSNEYTQYTFFNIKKKIILNYPKSTFIGYFPRDSRICLKHVRNSRGNQAISVGATEGLLYFIKLTML